MDDQRKDHIDQEGPRQEMRPKQLQTHNLPTDDAENINSTNSGRYLILAYKPQIVPWGTERVRQRIKRHSRITLRRSVHRKREQGQTEKSMAWIDYKKAYNIVPQSWITNC